MAIRGDLLSADLSNVFQMLALNRKSGQLLVQEQGNLLNKRRLYVRADRVSLNEELPERPIIALLVEMGVITYAQYREVVSKSSRYGSDPIRLLRQMGLLDDKQMVRVRHRVEEEGVQEVFLWRNITFELDEDAPAPAEGTPEFGIDQLIMESARRQDEWSQFVEITGVNRQIYVRSGHLKSTEGLDLEAIPHIVLDFVDGVRGSREIVEETGLPRYFVDLSLRGLHDAGYIAPLGLSELITTGDRLVEQDHHASGLRLFRAALQFDRRNLTLHQRLARAYYDTGRIAKSAAHYRFCAMSMLASGQRRDALDLYENVLKLLPTDFKTLERCLDLLAQQGAAPTPDDREVCANARKLLSFYLDTQQDGPALAIIENLQRVGEDEEELINTAARLHLRSGHTEKAVQAYMNQAQRRSESQDLAGALDLYRTLSSIDPSNRQTYQSKIAEIHRIKDQARRRKRRIRIALVSLSLVVLASLGYAAYALAASSELRRLPSGDPKDREEADRRIHRFEALSNDYPLTPAAFEANNRADRARSWIARQEQARQAAEDQILALRAGAVQQANDQFEIGLDLLGKRELVEAVAHFRAALELVGKAEAPWKHMGETRNQIKSIEQYLQKGRALLREGRAAWQRGDLETARAKLMPAIANYKSLPSLKGVKLELPIRIVAFPSTARITSTRPDGSEITGQGSLVFSIVQDANIKFTVEHQGFEAVERIASGDGEWDFSIILERTDGQRARVDEPLAAVHGLPDGSVALIARNGKVAAVRPGALDATPTWGRPRSLMSLRLSPAVNSSGILVASERGRFRLVDRRLGATLWDVSVPKVTGSDTILRPMPMGRDFIVCGLANDGGNRIARLSRRNGEPIWSATVLGQVSALTASPRGVAVMTEDGALYLLSAKTGAQINRLEGPFSGEPANGSDGRLLIHRVDVGVQALEWNGTSPTTVLTVKPAITGAPCDLAGTIVVSAGGTIFIGRNGDFVRLPVTNSLAGLMRGPRLCAARLDDGRLLIIDPAKRSISFAVRAPGVPSQAVALTDTHLILKVQESQIIVYELR